jgi:hypothetical protein
MTSRQDPDLADPNNWPLGSGSLTQDYGFTDPDPKEISTNQQHRK